MTKAAELAKMGEVLINSQIGGRRNIAYNGAMQISQRSTSETGLGATSGYFTLDRYKTIISGTAGRFTMSQDSDAPTGFANSLKIDCTTADTSIAASEYYLLSQLFEGYDVQQIKKGTSDAEKVTVSFYVKGNAAATYTCELEDSDNGRRNSQTFAVTTSWNRVVLTFNADTTGTFDNNNGGSLALNFWLHAGSTFTGGTFSNNSWGTGTDTRASSSQTSIFDSTDRTFFITGVQLEVGSQATPFEHRSFGEELALCQRYYQQYDYTGTYQHFLDAQANSANTARGIFPLIASMRTNPTVSNNGVGNFRINAYSGGVDETCNTITINHAEETYISISFIKATSNLTTNMNMYINTQATNDASLYVDAEL